MQVQFAVIKDLVLIGGRFLAALSHCMKCFNCYMHARLSSNAQTYHALQGYLPNVLFINNFKYLVY